MGWNHGLKTQVRICNCWSASRLGYKTAWRDRTDGIGKVLKHGGTNGYQRKLEGRFGAFRECEIDLTVTSSSRSHAIVAFLCA
jgi:hypothetical protein